MYSYASSAASWLGAPWEEKGGFPEKGGVMDTLKKEAPRARDTGRSRRAWRIVLAIALALALVAVGSWAVVEVTQSDDAESAADLADKWLAAANANDGTGAGLLFTEDAILEMPHATSEGRDAIVSDVNYWSPVVDGWRRIGDITETEQGTFVFAAEGNFEGPKAGEGEIVLENDLISHLTWRCCWSQAD